MIVKISDYGTSRYFSNEDEVFSTNCGTELYASPDIIEGNNYTVKSDLYSFGVICYVLLTNSFPFGDTKEEHRQKIKNRVPLQFPQHIPIDSELIDLISHLITYEESDRYSWEEFYKHSYVKRVCGNTFIPTDEHLQEFKEMELDL